MIVDSACKNAIRIAWIILTGISLLPVVLALSSRKLLYRLSDAMSIAHSDCPFCGMTRASDAMAQGNFALAHHYNKGAILLAALIFINAVVCLLYCIVLLRKRAAQKAKLR
ncbi:MAG: DUF2752 domain-containing protein [Bradymonadales bacterium]